MKWFLLLMALLAMALAWPGEIPTAQCPEDPNDQGICDTMFVEVLPSDVIFTGPGGLVRVAIRFTHDLPDPLFDSLCCFYVPLCFTHTNPTKYCSLSRYWNNNNLWVSPMERSVFRHLEGETNLVQAEWEQHGWCGIWYFWELTMDGFSHFGLPLGPDEMCYYLIGPANRGLLATMTFRVEDTMTVCIDSCSLSWPNHLEFMAGSGAYTPRHNLPYCFSISAPEIGDVTADGIIDLGDVIFLINYLYRQGAPPPYPGVADVNDDGAVDLGDVVYLINYLFKGGLPPG